MPSHNIPPSMYAVNFSRGDSKLSSAVTSKNDSSTDAVCFHWAVLRFFLCCCFYYLCSSIIFVLTCVLSRCLRVASSPLQSSLHLIHLTSLRRRYHPQPRQLELSLVVPLKILHQILYFIEPSSESISRKTWGCWFFIEFCIFSFANASTEYFC